MFSSASTRLPPLSPSSHFFSPFPLRNSSSSTFLRLSLPPPFPLRRYKNSSHIKHAHSVLVENSHDDNLLPHDALLRAYAKCGAVDDLRTIFSRLHQRSAASWAHLMVAHSLCGQTAQALQCFNQMCMEGTVPERPSLLGILASFQEPGFLEETKRVHVYVLACGLHLDVVVGTNVVNAYSNNCNLASAKRVFDGMRERDVVLWTALISSYIQIGPEECVSHLLDQMMMEGVMSNEFTYASILASGSGAVDLRKGKSVHACVICSDYASDMFVRNGLLNMYSKCGSFEDVASMFGDVDCPNIISWNAVITACNDHGKGEIALLYVKQMQKRGTFPDEITFISAFDAFANHAALNEGIQLHTHLLHMGLDVGLNLGNAILNMYGKCGCVQKAWSVFIRIPDRNVITWTTMIASYAQQGLADEALDLASEMFQAGVVPNPITYVNLLYACSHSGLLCKACQYFALMKQSGVIPTLEHFNCMVDLLGRAGLLEEGEILLNSMPLQASCTIWTTLLGGCRLHLDVERGERSAVCLLQLETEEIGPYVLICNIHSAEDAEETLIQQEHCADGTEQKDHSNGTIRIQFI